MHYSESSFAAALETSSSVASSFASVQSTSRLAPQAATTSSNLALLQPNPSARHPNKSRSNSVDRNGSVSYLSSLPIQPPSAPPPPMPPSSMSARCTSNRTARKRTPSTPHPTPSVTPPPEVTGLAAELFISTARNATTVSSSLLNAASAVNPATTPSSSAIGSLSLTFQRPPVCRIQANKYSSGVLQQEQSSKHAEHTAFPSTGPPVPERHTDIRVIAAYVPPVRRRSASCGATGRERDTPRLASHSAIIMDNQPSTITAKESLADELDNLRQALSTLKSFWDGPLGAPPGASSARESLRWRDRGGFAAFVRAVVRNGGDDISTLQQAKVEDRTCESAKRDASDMVERGIAREGQLNGSRARDEEVEQVVRWIKAHPAMLPVLVMDIRDWDGYRLMLRRHEVLKEKGSRPLLIHRPCFLVSSQVS
ncbi:hypothetical protein DFJ73DRAFT_502169 [Zopfochytrium polystomum]|nr:hypothetical protein DFJ73DRAFT_502169 [Zopfochytrium polystomum]